MLGFVLVLVMSLAAAAPIGVAQATPASERWALLIGVDRFEGRTRPNYGAVNDVMLFRDALVRSGWSDDHIKVLVDGGARAADIRAGMRWLVERTNDQSLSAVHYSGHVKQVGSTVSLWPHDNRFIPDTEVASTLSQLRGKSWIDISGCEAAAFDKGLSAPNRLFTASSRGDEKSYEMVSARKSIFSMLLVEQGMLEGRADDNSDGRVSVQEAFRFAAERAPELSRAGPNGPQHPQIAGGDGTEFFLDPPPPPAAPVDGCTGFRLLGIFCVPKLF
ncbi:MAG: caspase family protein [Acidimicrobiales bacterium]